MKKAFLFFLVYSAFCSDVFAASFDCAKASTDVEKIICSNNDLSNIDEDLSLLYSQAKNVLPDKQSLKKEQMQWIRQKRSCGLDYNCIYQKYIDRKKELSWLISAVPVQNYDSSSNTVTPTQFVMENNQKKESPNIDSTFQIVKICFESKDYQCAKQKLDQLLAFYPDNRLAKVGLLNITMAECIDRKDYSCALDAVNQWVILTPDDGRALDAKVKIERAFTSTTVSNPSPQIPPNPSEKIALQAQTNIADSEVTRKYEAQLEHARLENKILSEKVENQKLLNELHNEINKPIQETEIEDKTKVQVVSDVKENISTKSGSIIAPFENNKVYTQSTSIAQANPTTEDSEKTLDNSYEFSVSSIAIGALFGCIFVYILLRKRGKKHKNINTNLNEPSSKGNIITERDKILVTSYEHFLAADSDGNIRANVVYYSIDNEQVIGSYSGYAGDGNSDCKFIWLDATSTCSECIVTDDETEFKESLAPYCFALQKIRAEYENWDNDNRIKISEKGRDFLSSDDSNDCIKINMSQEFNLDIIKLIQEQGSLLYIINNKDEAANKINIYLRTEPAGEYSLHKLTDEELARFKVSFSSTENFKESDFFSDIVSNNLTNCLGSAYGLLTDLDNESDGFDFGVNYKCTATIRTPFDYDGIYVVLSTPSKMTLDISVNTPDGKPYDSNALTFEYSEVFLPEVEDEYGEIDFCIITNVLYKGIPLVENLGDYIDDRGGQYNVSIFTFHEGNFALLFKSQGDSEIIVDSRAFEVFAQSSSFSSDSDAKNPESTPIFELVVESSGEKVFACPLSFELMSSIISKTPDNEDNSATFKLAAQHPSTRVREMVACKDNLSSEIYEILINDRSIEVLRNYARSNSFRIYAKYNDIVKLVHRDTEIAKSIADNAEYFDEISAAEIAKIITELGDPSVTASLDSILSGVL